MSVHYMGAAAFAALQSRRRTQAAKREKNSESLTVSDTVRRALDEGEPCSECRRIGEPDCDFPDCFEEVLSDLEYERGYYAKPQHYQEEEYYIRCEAKEEILAEVIRDIKHRYGLIK